MIDIALLQQWVGRERTVVDELRSFPAQALAAALDRAQQPDCGDLLPPAWQWLYFLDTPTGCATGTDGHAKLDAKGFLPPVPLPRRMWAAGAMTIERPLRLGQPASRRSTIRSVDAKRGKSGTLVFVTLDHRYEQGGQLCIREEQSLVYREIPPGPAPLPRGEPAPAAAEWSRSMHPDPVLLFRYSALTYNGHRIHYDRPYAVGQEHYPGLVVHGPLQATLLLDLLERELPYANVAEFRFRAMRPAFDAQPLGLHGRRAGDALELWSANDEGHLCMNATARLA